ncbi:MAG TPA: radical SAM protein [Gemmatimonadaceae bacterium]|nr:radical SAM protein [Gemmatimonadaceae bacterium]
MSCLFEITPTCNLRCHFCYVALDPYKGPYLTTEQACGVIDKLADEAGVLSLTLTGGEIFSRRDFPEIYSYAWSKGLLVTLFTNATMVTEKVAALLRERPPHVVDVTIYGADAEHYEATTGIRGSFAKFERGIRLLQEAGVRLTMKHTTSNLTADHLHAVRAYCEERGIPHRFGVTIEGRHDGGDEPTLYRITPRKVVELRDTVHQLRTGYARDRALPECSAGADLPGASERLYQCGAGRAALFVDALGQVSHCVLDREPSFPLLEMPWPEIWERIGEWVNQPLPANAPCSGCSLRGGCENCPARSRAATGSPYLKDTYQCDITHAEYGLEPERHPDYRNLARPVGACVN